MKQKYRGLCETCIHEPECTFPRKPERGVLCCDEFEGITKSVEAEVSDRAAGQKAHSGTGDADPDGSGGTKGLCRTCSKRGTCTYPKHEGGVWHCDEYE